MFAASLRMFMTRATMVSLLGVVLGILCGCRSLAPQPAIDFSGPGWSVRQGQVIWRANRAAEGVAGELLVALHPDGRCVVHFSKTLPFLEAQRGTNGWQVTIIPQHKTYSARGTPPARLIWLHLPEALRSGRAPNDFRFSPTANGHWRFERITTGESLEGYLEGPRGQSVVMTCFGSDSLKT